MARTKATTRFGGAGLLVAGLAVTHGTMDAYAAFLHPLLPRIMARLGLSITLAATLVMTLSVAASVLQPAFGYLADRFGRRPWLVGGPVLSGVFLSLIGVAPGFGVLLLFLVLGGLGSAAFHPSGASVAARAGAGRGSGWRLSVFSFGGTVGYAVGPLAAVALVAGLGLEGLWVAMLPVLVLGIGLALLLPADGPSRSRPPPHPLRVLAALRGPLGLVFGISVLGAFVQRSFLMFEPIIAAEAGRAEATGAALLSLYLGAQALGTLASGALTDRLDRRHILAVASVLAVPAHVVAFTAPAGSAIGLVAIVAAGLLNMALLPPVVVMAQEMIPDGTAVSSGIVMGLAWATGAVGVLGAGALADRIGPVAAAAWSMPVLLLGAALALHPALKPYSRPSTHAAGAIPEIR